jgi:hypothetical protein
MQDVEDELDLLKKYLSGYRRKFIFFYFLLNRLFVLGLFLKSTIALIIDLYVFTMLIDVPTFAIH